MDLTIYETEFNRVAKTHNTSVDWATERGYLEQAIEADYRIGKATPISLRNAILNIAKTGLSISPLEGMAYIDVRGVNTAAKNKPKVYRNDAAFRIQYKGLIVSLVDCGAVEWIRADVVKEGDNFVYNGPASRPDPGVIDPFGASRAGPVGAYAIAKLPSGDIMCEILDANDIAAMKAASTAQYGPWGSAFVLEMWKKSAINRMCKTMPRKLGSRADHIINANASGDALDFDDMPSGADYPDPVAADPTPTENMDQSDPHAPEVVEPIDANDMMELEAACKKVGLAYSIFMDYAGKNRRVYDGVLKGDKNDLPVLFAKIEDTGKKIAAKAKAAEQAQ